VLFVRVFKVRLPTNIQYLLNNRELAKRDKGQNIIQNGMRSDVPSQYCMSDKNAFIYRALSIKINRTKYIHTKIFYTTVVSALNQTPKQILILLQGVCDNIDFISQNSSKRGGDG
jgi:hypothetical protein